MEKRIKIIVHDYCDESKTFDEETKSKNKEYYKHLLEETEEAKTKYRPTKDGYEIQQPDGTWKEHKIGYWR